MTIVDSGEAAAVDVEAFLRERGLSATGVAAGSLDLLVTDLPKSFAEMASRFLGHETESVQAIDL